MGSRLIAQRRREDARDHARRNDVAGLEMLSSRDKIVGKPGEHDLRPAQRIAPIPRLTTLPLIAASAPIFA